MKRRTRVKSVKNGIFDEWIVIIFVLKFCCFEEMDGGLHKAMESGEK